MLFFNNLRDGVKIHVYKQYGDTTGVQYYILQGPWVKRLRQLPREQKVLSDKTITACTSRVDFYISIYLSIYLYSTLLRINALNEKFDLLFTNKKFCVTTHQEFPLSAAFSPNLKLEQEKPENCLPQSLGLSQVGNSQQHK